MNDKTDEFWVLYGDVVFDALTECICSRDQETVDLGDGRKLVMMDFHKRDMINCSGRFCFTDTNGEEVIATFDDGNNNGTVIWDFGPDVGFEQPPRVARKYVLDEARLVAEGASLEKARVQFERNRQEIEKKQRDMNYDFYFSPTNAIHQHYRDWAAERFLTIEVSGA